MGALRLILDNVDDAYIVCDTPAYDFHFINYYLDREGLPLDRFGRLMTRDAHGIPTAMGDE